MSSFISSLDSNNLFDILKQSNEATAIYTSYNLIIQFVNNPMLKIWGKNESVHGKRFEDALPEMEGQPFTQLLKNVWLQEKEYNATDTPATLEINGEMITSYFDFTYKPIFDEKGKIFCILHTAADVTERVNAQMLILQKDAKEKQITEELTIANREFKITHYNLNKSIAELATLNGKYSEVNIKLKEANDKINFLNNELKKENTDLIFDNKELEKLNKTILNLNNKIIESETSFGHLIEQAPVATLLVKGNEFIITMINKSMLELIGKDESIIGKKLFEELPELIGQPAANMLMETFEKGISHQDYSSPVFINRRGKLEKGYFNFTYTPLIENGKVVGVIDMATEVTPQVLAIQEKDDTILQKSLLEETLRKSEERLQGILETMAEGVCVVNDEGKVVYINPMAQNILGISEKDIQMKTYSELNLTTTKLDGSQLPQDEYPIYLIFKNKKSIYDYEIGICTPNQQQKYISVNAAPLFDQNGKISGGIATFMDVTARRMTIQGKDDFISIASHELKTPVTALKATLQLLKRSHSKLSAESREKLLLQSNNSLEKLSGLISNLLDASRIDHGQLYLEKKAILISDLFEDCRSTITTDPQKIIVRGDLNQMIEGDSLQIGRVITNLINNALKYANNSEKIILSAELIDNQNIKICIIDEGPGIPAEKIPHLFERYYRTDYSGQKFSGLGLGLYICSDIITKHGGKIGVESEIGKGTEFWFTLPLYH